MSMRAFFFFFTLNTLLCAMFTESLKLYLTFPYNTGDSHTVLRKGNCCFSLFSLSSQNCTFLLLLSLFLWLRGVGPVPGTPARSCPACELRVQWFPGLLRRRTTPSSSVCTCHKQHHLRVCSVRCPGKVKRNEWGKSQTERNWKNAMDEISKELFLRNNSNRKPLPFHFLRFWSLSLQRDLKRTTCVNAILPCVRVVTKVDSWLTCSPATVLCWLSPE